MEKITKSMNDKIARLNAINDLGLEGLAQISNTEFAVMAKDAEGNDKVVTIKFTVPKNQIAIDDLVDAYEADKAEKAIRAEERASKAKAKKEA